MSIYNSKRVTTVWPRFRDVVRSSMGWDMLPDAFSCMSLCNVDPNSLRTQDQLTDKVFQSASEGSFLCLLGLYISGHRVNDVLYIPNEFLEKARQERDLVDSFLSNMEYREQLGPKYLSLWGDN